MTADRADRGIGRPGAGHLGRLQGRWRGLDRGWQASLLGVLVVAVVLVL